MSKVILFKNNKGGVGKSMICFWTGHILSRNSKVLIITSDSQNNIMQMAGVEGEFRDGLQGYIEDNNKHRDLIKLRDNLFYIPLKDSKIKRTFEEKFLKTIESFKKIYDYILIDGSPVLKLDSIFLEASDKIVIPTYLDKVTTKGIINLIGEVGAEKVQIVIPNRVGRTKLEKDNYEKLKSTLESNDISISRQIYQSSLVTSLIEKSSTIMETQNKKYDYLKETFFKIVKEIM